MSMENISQEPIKEERKSMDWAGSTWLAKWVISIATIALSIIGLSSVLTEWMLGLTAILAGIAFLFQGGAIGARFSSLISGTRHGDLAALELGGGMVSEFLGGAAGIVLGILSLLGVLPTTLVPVAAITFGGTLLISLAVTSHLDDLQIEEACEKEEARAMIHLAVRSAKGLQIFIGLGSLVLGILAVIGLAPVVLSLIAMLSVGFFSLVRVAALSERLLNAFHCA
jgi:hypothetical protein